MLSLNGFHLFAQGGGWMLGPQRDTLSILCQEHLLGVFKEFWLWSFWHWLNQSFGNVYSFHPCSTFWTTSISLSEDSCIENKIRFPYLTQSYRKNKIRFPYLTQLHRKNKLRFPYLTQLLGISPAPCASHNQWYKCSRVGVYVDVSGFQNYKANVQYVSVV